MSAWPDSGMWLAVAAVFWLAGLVKGVVGLGLPTVSMALLALLMPPAQAAALLVAPSLLTNLWQARPWASAWPLLRQLGGMQLGVCAGTALGAAWFGVAGTPWAGAALGAVLLAYAAWGLAGVPLAVPAGTQRWLGPLAGAVTGVLTTLTGVFVVPAVPYLQAIGLQRDALMQAMGISFSVSTLALAAGLFVSGGEMTAMAGASLWMLLPALLGMAVGQGLRRLLSPLAFRRVFFGSLMLLGLHLVLR